MSGVAGWDSFHAFPYSLDSSFYAGEKEALLLLSHPVPEQKAPDPRKLHAVLAWLPLSPHPHSGEPGAPSHHLQPHLSCLQKPARLLLPHSKVLSGTERTDMLGRVSECFVPALGPREAPPCLHEQLWDSPVGLRTHPAWCLATLNSAALPEWDSGSQQAAQPPSMPGS